MAIIIHPESEEQENLFEQLAKALKVPFEKSEEKPYNHQFTIKIDQGIEDSKKGLGRKITLDELDNLWK